MAPWWGVGERSPGEEWVDGSAGLRRALPRLAAPRKQPPLT